jgi:hypothetical protein
MSVVAGVQGEPTPVPHREQRKSGRENEVIRRKGTVLMKRDSFLFSYFKGSPFCAQMSKVKRK